MRLVVAMLFNHMGFSSFDSFDSLPPLQQASSTHISSADVKIESGVEKFQSKTRGLHHTADEENMRAAVSVLYTAPAVDTQNDLYQLSDTR